MMQSMNPFQILGMINNMQNPQAMMQQLSQQDKGTGTDSFGGGWLWVFFLFFLLAWGGGGMFGGNNAGAAATAARYVTQADLQRGFDQQSINRSFSDIGNGLSSLGYDQLAQMNGINTNVSQTGFNIQNAILNSATQTQSGIAELGYNMQNCCCTTNRNIDSVRYENAQNTCNIINAGHADTQHIIDTITQNEIQNLQSFVQHKDILSIMQTSLQRSVPVHFQRFFQPNGMGIHEWKFQRA